MKSSRGSFIRRKAISQSWKSMASGMKKSLISVMIFWIFLSCGGLDFRSVLLMALTRQNKFHTMSHYVTQKKWGEGAVREVVEMLLNGLGKKEETIASLLSPSKNSAQKGRR